jgi:rhodanese-related sulfurtransferase
MKRDVGVFCNYLVLQLFRARQLYAPWKCKNSCMRNCWAFINLMYAQALFWCAIAEFMEPAMPHPADIIQVARQRGQDQQLPYAGAVTPQEAFNLLQADSRVKLIDVRTTAERDWVGRVAIPEAQHAAVQWNLYPGGKPNPDFLAQLMHNTAKDDILVFLCRSGVRSRHAAKLATENGYTHCFDILEGFEGDKDNEGHRKTVAGWCKAGLPWLGA